MKSAEPIEAIKFWNEHYEEIALMARAGGEKYVMLLPNPAFGIFLGSYSELEEIAQARGYEHPFIAPAPTGKEAIQSRG